MQKGKNLINPKSFNNFTAGIQFIPFNVKPNTDYTLSSNIPVSGVSANLFLSTTTDTSNVSSSANGVFPGEPRTINSSSNTTIYVGYRDADNVLTNEANNYWYQLEQNSTATEYEEYIEPKMYILNDNNVYEEFMKKHEEIYSTEEQVVGKWDGKPLYRRIVEVLAPSQSTSSTEIYSLPNNCNIQKVSGHLISTFEVKYNLNSYFSSTDYIYTFVQSNNYTVLMKIGNAAYIGSKVLLILEYTKTTD